MHACSPESTPRRSGARQGRAAALLVSGLALLFVFTALSARSGAASRPVYQSPQDVAYSGDGKLLAVCDYTSNALAILDAATGKTARKVSLDQPAGVAWDASGDRVLVTERMAGTLAEVDAKSGKVVRRVTVGPRPVGVAVAAKRRLAVTANEVGTISVVDLAKGKEAARIAATGSPFGVAITPDERLALVTDLFPFHSATDPADSASVEVIDLATLKRVAAIRLPAGGVGVHEIAVSPDGKWAYVVHVVGRFNVPTTQLDRGWVNTNALSVIDLAKKEVYATLLLDHPHEGAADPWGIVLSRDGKTAWITLSGVHSLARLDLAGLHNFLEGKIPEGHWLNKTSAEYSASTRSTWLEIKKDPKQRSELVNDLSALYVAEVIQKTLLPANGVRGLDLSPDGQRLAVASYYTGQVLVVDPATCKSAETFALGPQVKPDQVRFGEMVFHDATYCFQHWLSCTTCHPNEGRADGLNWDLLNDGIGNPKNTKSMLLAYKTPPAMAHGIRATMEVAAEAGFRFILFREPEKEELTAVWAYLRSLTPEKSPYLVNGKLSPAAQRGKKIFESPKTKCASCHPTTLFTDLKLYDVGTRSELDQGEIFDTPTLIEAWRTPPYLHDGSAVTIQDVLTTRNKGDKHGVTSHLKPNEIDDLAAYVLSL